MAFSLPELLPFILPKLQRALRQPVQISWGAGAALLRIGGCDFPVVPCCAEGIPSISQCRQGPSHLPQSIAVAPYIPLQVARWLRQQGQYYADAMGNAWLQAPQQGVDLLVSGKRGQKLLRVTGAAFAPDGLRLLLQVLACPVVLRCSDRELAKQTSLQRPALAAALLDLERQGFLRPGSGRGLLNPRALLHRWLTGYREQWWPQLWKGRYRRVGPWPGAHGWLQLARQSNSLVGGTLAAQLLLERDSSPEAITLYHTSADHLYRPALAGLVPDPMGPVEVVHSHPAPVASALAGCAHPLLVYSDLWHTGDQRNRRLAEQLVARCLPHLRP